VIGDDKVKAPRSATKRERASEKAAKQLESIGI
jgi:hypothetical protein